MRRAEAVRASLEKKRGGEQERNQHRPSPASPAPKLHHPTSLAVVVGRCRRLRNPTKRDRSVSCALIGIIGTEKREDELRLLLLVFFFPPDCTQFCFWVSTAGWLDGYSAGIVVEMEGRGGGGFAGHVPCKTQCQFRRPKRRYITRLFLVMLFREST